MSRSAYILLVAFLVSCTSIPPHPHLSFDESGNVTEFYGIPTQLTFGGIKDLPFDVRVGQLMLEGDWYPSAEAAAEDGVEIRLIFGTDGSLDSITTFSSHAVGPKGIGVGSLLSAVRKAWPEGRLIIGNETGPYVRYITGTNVILQFEPADVDPGLFDDHPPAQSEISDLRVRAVEVRPWPVPA